MTIPRSPAFHGIFPCANFSRQTGQFYQLRSIFLAGAFTVLANPSMAQSIADIGTVPGLPAGQTINDETAISANGQFLAITGGSEAFRRAADGSYLALGKLNGGGNATVRAINSDGSVIVGQADDGVTGAWRAVRWTQATGFVSLGTLGGSESNAYGVSDDGTKVTGNSTLSNGQNRAFLWTQGVGMQNLGILGTGSESYGLGISRDGSTVVGYFNDSTASGFYRAFRWTQATGMVRLGTLNNGDDSYAQAANRDGSVIVGYSADGSASGQYRAFRWTQPTGMSSLGVLAGGDYSKARAVSADGSVVVGDATTSTTQVGFRWTQATGMLSVEQWLRSYGVTVADGTTNSASGVSADGAIVVGKLQNGNVYIARGPVTVPSSDGGQTSTTAGLMNVPNYLQSLPSISGPLSVNADMAINGAHSSPLFMLLDAGQSSLWFTGDGARAEARLFNGGLGTAEIGFGHGLAGGWTVRLAGGGQYSRFDINNNGNTTFSGLYVAPEISYSFNARFIGTVTGYYNWSKADIRRAYLNANSNDTSFGMTSAQTFALRARLDWKDALMLAETRISPYISYTYINARADGYTENEGSFPARFNGISEISNSLRIGADALTPLTEKFTLLTRLEYGHRFEQVGAGVSGEILGLSAFSLDASPVQQDWVRLGLGVTYKLNHGDGMVMVNTSNQTGKNTTWLSASYRVRF